MQLAYNYITSTVFGHPNSDLIPADAILSSRGLTHPNGLSGFFDAGDCAVDTFLQLLNRRFHFIHFLLLYPGALQPWYDVMLGREGGGGLEGRDERREGERQGRQGGRERG